MRNWWSFYLVVAPLSLIINGCTGLYFHDAPTPPPHIQYALDAWPYEEYWTADTLVVPGTTTEIMPSGESVCFYSASVSPTGLVGSDLFGTETWSFLIFADPGIGFR